MSGYLYFEYFFIIVWTLTKEEQKKIIENCCACTTTVSPTTTTQGSTTTSPPTTTQGSTTTSPPTTTQGSTTTAPTTTTQLTTFITCKPNSPNAIILSGGWPERRSVEVYNEDFTHLKTLPDLTEDRAAHTQSGLLTCGGTYSRNDCESFNPDVGIDGTWNPFVLTGASRHYHSSWTSDHGTYLIGGWSYHAQLSAAKITANVDTFSFPLNTET